MIRARGEDRLKVGETVTLAGGEFEKNGRKVATFTFQITTKDVHANDQSVAALQDAVFRPADRNSPSRRSQSSSRGSFRWRSRPSMSPRCSDTPPFSAPARHALPVVGPLYPPWDLIWAWKWRDVVAAQPMLSAGVRIFEYPTLIIGVAAMIVVQLSGAWMHRRSPRLRSWADRRAQGDRPSRRRRRCICRRVAKRQKNPLSARRGAGSRARLRADAHRQGRRTGSSNPAQLAPQRRGSRHQGRELGAYRGMAAARDSAASAFGSTRPAPTARPRATTRCRRSGSAHRKSKTRRTSRTC